MIDSSQNVQKPSEPQHSNCKITSSPVFLILITAAVNTIFVSGAAWVVSRNSISLSEEHNLVSALIPILTSDDGIKVQMGLNLLKEALPLKAERYEKIINERVKNTAISTISQSTPDIGFDISKSYQRRGVLDLLSTDPKFANIISESVKQVQKENREELRGEVEKKKTESKVKSLLTLGQEKLDRNDCFSAYIAFDSASEIDRKNVIIETSKKIAFQCISKEKNGALDQYLKERIRNLESEASRFEGKAEALKKQNGRLSPKEINEFWNRH